MDAWCRQRDPRTKKPAEATSRGLCLPCERHGLYAISQLPGDWVALSTELGKPLSSFNAGIPASRAEPPLFLRLSIDAAMRHIVWALETWERLVRRHSRLSAPPEFRVRPHIAVQRAAELLCTHYSALMALATVDYDAYNGAVVECDGLDAVAELVWLHHRARSLTGESRRWEKRRVPCPRPVLNGRGEPVGGGCGMETLGEWVGESPLGERIVECSNCGWRCTIDQYTLYATTFLPPDRKAA